MVDKTRMNSRYECQIDFFRSIKCPTRFLKFAQLVSNYLSFDVKLRQFDTKDVFSYEISYITVLTSNFSTLFKFPAVNLPVSLSPSLSLLSYARHGHCNNLSFLIWSWNDTFTPLVIVDHRLGQLLKIYNKVSVEL